MRHRFDVMIKEACTTMDAQHSTRVFIDYRWAGGHGLGRMTEEVAFRNRYSKLFFCGSPSSPIDPIRLTYSLFARVPRDGVFLTFGYSFPVFHYQRAVFTVADLNFIDVPDNSSFLKRVYFDLFVKSAIRRSSRIITISEFSKSRVVEWACISADRVFNVGCGVSEEFTSEGDKWMPGFQYVFMVGNRKTHKNEPRALVAFSEANLDNQIKLVISGDSTTELDDLVRRRNLSDRVVFLGRVSSNLLASIYRGALCLLFPSLYEGFGLPVVEAMACGTPVVTSNTTSLPEVAGDAAILVDPTSIDEIAYALEDVCSNTVLAEQLRTKGFLQAAKYNWASVALKVDEIVKTS